MPGSSISASDTRPRSCPLQTEVTVNRIRRVLPAGTLTCAWPVRSSAGSSDRAMPRSVRTVRVATRAPPVPKVSRTRSGSVTGWGIRTSRYWPVANAPDVHAVSASWSKACQPVCVSVASLEVLIRVTASLSAVTSGRSNGSQSCCGRTDR